MARTGSVTFQSGNARLKGPIKAAPTSAAASTRCRRAAERLAREALSSRPSASMTEDRIARPASNVTASPPFAPGMSRQFFDARVFHEVLDSRQFLVRDAEGFAAEQRRDRLGG